MSAKEFLQSELKAHTCNICNVENSIVYSLKINDVYKNFCNSCMASFLEFILNDSITEQVYYIEEFLKRRKENVG